MQSTIAVACRGLVMLSVLVALPMAALLGSSLPDVARSLLALGESTDQQESPPQAPLIRGPAKIVDAEDPPSAQASKRPAQAHGVGLLGLSPGDMMSAGFSMPDDLDNLPEAARAAVAPIDWPVIPPAPAGQPEGGSSLARLSPIPPSPTPVASVEGDTRYLAIQERLRQLGATYYLLEPWGSGGQLYRFQCRMAVCGNPNCNRYFEAIDPQPLTAMTRVLDEVETWRSDGTALAHGTGNRGQGDRG